MSIFKCMADLLTGGENLVLATIVSRSGSAPRAVGSRMAVRQDGAIIGTIGGGILEARVQELAKEVFHQRQAVLKKYALTAQDASQMGMVCGGVVQVLVQFLDASRAGQPGALPGPSGLPWGPGGGHGCLPKCPPLSMSRGLRPSSSEKVTARRLWAPGSPSRAGSH